MWRTLATKGVTHSVSMATMVGSRSGDGVAVGWEIKVLTAAFINVICPLTNYNY